MTKSYINSRTINHVVIYSYTLLYGFNQQLTNPISLLSFNKFETSVVISLYRRSESSGFHVANTYFLRQFITDFLKFKSLILHDSSNSVFFESCLRTS